MNPAAQQLLFFVVLAIGGWFLLVRPQRTRAKALQQVRQALRPGSRVITTAGLHATVAAVDGETVLLEIAPGVQARFASGAVVRVLDEPEAPGTVAADDQGAPPA
ncbi:MAG: preprotein translocase, YajC subunit [Frankiales bacterium]|jgi:preprotein translocase subunit YajC|nr:preprotein translocase, YajC subunit [Frankiales bacterium]